MSLGIVKELVGPVTGLLSEFIEDKDQKAKLAHEIATMAERHANENAKAQLEVNKVEAANRNLFVAGWRPAVGWVCVLGMAGNFMVIPFANFVLALIPPAAGTALVRECACLCHLRCSPEEDLPGPSPTPCQPQTSSTFFEQDNTNPRAL